MDIRPRRLKVNHPLNVEEHLMFKELLEEKDPSALKALHDFEFKNDKVAFEKAVRKLLLRQQTITPEKIDKVCMHFKKLGRCNYGDNCRYLHVTEPKNHRNKHSTPVKQSADNEQSNNSDGPSQNQTATALLRAVLQTKPSPSRPAETRTHEQTAPQILPPAAGLCLGPPGLSNANPNNASSWQSTSSSAPALAPATQTLEMESSLFGNGPTSNGNAPAQALNPLERLLRSAGGGLSSLSLSTPSYQLQPLLDPPRQAFPPRGADPSLDFNFSSTSASESFSAGTINRAAGNSLLAALRKSPSPAPHSPVHPHNHRGLFSTPTLSQDFNTAWRDTAVGLGELRKDEQKSQALLNILQFGAQPTQNSTTNMDSAHTSARPMDPIQALLSPVAKTRPPTEVQFETPEVKTAPKEQGPPVPPTTGQKKNMRHRVTRPQPGRVFGKVKNQNLDDSHCIYPGTAITVQWQLPEQFLAAIPRQEREQMDLVLGLVRYGAMFNHPCIVTKSLSLSSAQSFSDVQGGNRVWGSVKFYAPKAAGHFCFRLFDQASRESSVHTLGTSARFRVGLHGQAVANNLLFITEALGESLPWRGLSQFPEILRGMLDTGHGANDRSPAHLLNKNVSFLVGLIDVEGQQVLDRVQDMKRVTQDRNEKKKKPPPEGETAAGEESSSPIEDASEDDHEEKGKEGDEGVSEADLTEFWTKYKYISRLHQEVHEVFQALQESRVPWQLLDESVQRKVRFLELLYCPLLQRYFESLEQRDRLRGLHFGFVPAADKTVDLSPSTWSALEASIQKTLPTLLPGPSFLPSREAVRSRIERLLLEAEVLPRGTQLAMYGSSSNGFGSERADLDMCVLLPDSSAGLRQGGLIVASCLFESPPEQQQVDVEVLAEVLRGAGMEDVSSRPTARIPIVLFKDPSSGLECDISLHNPLALANTKLLRTYADADPRVRELAFVVKHWARARHLNDPGSHTLSSYGWILCLIHFLQSRAAPVVPNLQRIPPHWAGEPLDLRQRLPRVLRDSVDRAPCDVYFFSPAEHPDILQRFGSQSGESTTRLLLQFFHYFAWHFDFKQTVVSVRVGDTVDKTDKAETDAWNANDHLSIEDPFETYYDVAHVLKSPQMNYLRQELLRAFTLASKLQPASATQTHDSPLGTSWTQDQDLRVQTLAAEDFLSVLCRPADPPTFVITARERREAVL